MCQGTAAYSGTFRKTKLSSCLPAARGTFPHGSITVRANSLSLKGSTDSLTSPQVATCLCLLVSGSALQVDSRWWRAKRVLTREEWAAWGWPPHPNTLVGIWDVTEGSSSASVWPINATSLNLCVKEELNIYVNSLARWQYIWTSVCLMEAFCLILCYLWVMCSHC